MLDKARILKTEEVTTSKMRRRFLIALKKDRRVKISVALVPIFVMFFLLATLVFPIISYHPGSGSTQTFYLNPGSRKTLTYSVYLPAGATFDTKVILEQGDTAKFTLTEQTYSNFGLGKVTTVASGPLASPSTLESVGTHDYHNANGLVVAKYTVVVVNINSFAQKGNVTFSFSSYFTVVTNPYFAAAGVVTLTVSATIAGLTLVSVSKDEGSYFYNIDSGLQSSKRGRTHKTSFRYVASGNKPIHPLVFIAISIVFLTTGFLLIQGTYIFAFLSYILLTLGGVIFITALLFWVIRMD